jgi:hypothetical protein
MRKPLKKSENAAQAEKIRSRTETITRTRLYSLFKG